MIRAAIITVLMIFIISCAPVASYNFQSISGNSYWMKGREIVEKSNGNIKILMNFDRVDDGKISFDVAVTNNGNKEIVVSPETFTCSFTTTENDTMIEHAISPESSIAELERRKTREMNDHKQSECLDDGMCLLEAFDMCDDHNKTPEEREKAWKEREQRDIDTAERRERHEKTIKKMKEDREFFSNTMLRKTSLFRNDSVSGKVLFTFPYKTDTMLLKCRIGEEQFSFVFSRIMQKEPKKGDSKKSRYPRH